MSGLLHSSVWQGAQLCFLPKSYENYKLLQRWDRLSYHLPSHHGTRSRPCGFPKGAQSMVSLFSPLVTSGHRRMRERVVGWGPEEEESLLIDERELCRKTSLSLGVFFPVCHQGHHCCLLMFLFICGLIFYSPKCIHFLILVKEWNI